MGAKRGITIKPTPRSRLIAASMFKRGRSVTVLPRSTGGRAPVDLALQLNVLALCAVFAFVGAILLGAF